MKDALIVLGKLPESENKSLGYKENNCSKFEKKLIQ